MPRTTHRPSAAAPVGDPPSPDTRQAHERSRMTALLSSRRRVSGVNDRRAVQPGHAARPRRAGHRRGRVGDLAAAAPSRPPRRAATQATVHVRLLASPRVPLAVGTVGQVAGQEEPDRLVGEARRGVQVDQQVAAAPARRSASSTSSRRAVIGSVLAVRRRAGRPAAPTGAAAPGAGTAGPARTRPSSSSAHDTDRAEVLARTSRSRLPPPGMVTRSVTTLKIGPRNRSTRSSTASRARGHDVPSLGTTRRPVRLGLGRERPTGSWSASVRDRRRDERREQRVRPGRAGS